MVFIIMTQNLICSRHFLFYAIVYHGMLAINYFKLKSMNEWITAERLMSVMFQLKQTLTNKLNQMKLWKFIVENKQQTWSCEYRDKFEVNRLSN